jgi:hypothetical protein
MKRFALVAAVAALLAGLTAMPGSSASFVDYTPCPASGPLLVCPKFQVGQTVSLQLMAFAGCDTYRWEMTNGGLPPGLSMSSTGLVTGRPTATGGTTPWITVHDLTASEGGPPWCGGDNKSERQFVFETLAGLDIDTQSVAPGTVNQAYSQQFAATSVTNLNPRQGSPASPSWTVQSGSLPTGVTLSSSGLLSGTPTQTGSFTFVVRATAGNATDTETETLSVRDPLVASSKVRGAKAEVGVPFTAQQSATGGNGTFTWSLASGTLPEGLELAADGNLTGTPTAAGRYTFVLRVADGEGRVVNVPSTLVVKAELTLVTLKLKAATVGRPYRATITTTGGVTPFVWSVRGKLPAGVKWAKKLHMFIGTPTKAGKYRVTVSAEDALDVKVQKTFTLVVK